MTTWWLIPKSVSQNVYYSILLFYSVILWNGSVFYFESSLIRLKVLFWQVYLGVTKVNLFFQVSDIVMAVEGRVDIFVSALPAFQWARSCFFSVIRRRRVSSHDSSPTAEKEQKQK